MNASSKDIAEYLESSAAGTGFTLSTDLFYSNIPDKPNQCVCIYDTGGFDQDPISEVYEKPTIQAMCRANSYDAAYTLAQSVKEALDLLINMEINSTRYVAIWQMSDILDLGKDKNNRDLVSINFRIHRTTT